MPSNLKRVFSDAIHEIAKKNSQQEGVWKVENHYVEDIENKYPEAQAQYNLVKEKQFSLHMLLDNELTPPSKKQNRDMIASLLQDEIKDEAFKTSQKMNLSPEEAQSRAKKIQGNLSKKHLNVVGEDHTISDKIRKEEKIYAAIFSGSSNYWKEDEFRVQDQKPGERGQLQKDDKRSFADPGDLKFFHSIWTVYNAGKKIDSSKTEGTDLSRNMYYFRNGIIYTNNLYAWLKEFDSGKYGLEKGEKEKFLSLHPQILDMALTWQDAYENYYQTIPNQPDRDKYPKPETYKQKYFSWVPTGKKVVTDKNEPLENYCNASVNALVNAVKQKELLRKWNLSENALEGSRVKIKTLAGVETNEESNEISILRSDKMHEAANERYDTRGVWKIGEKHVIEIKTKYPEEQINYNLVEAKSFYEHIVLGLYYAIGLVLGKPEDLKFLKQNLHI